MSVTSEFPLATKALLLFKSGLRQRQSELARAIDKTHKEICALADSEPGDVIDNSCGNSCKEAIFSSYSQSRTQLRKIQAALERIVAGEFGYCAACGGAIGLKRLQALPWTNNCIECQEESEQDRIH
jgi:DnaK suppressor protein